MIVPAGGLHMRANMHMRTSRQSYTYHISSLLQFARLCAEMFKTQKQNTTPNPINMFLKSKYAQIMLSHTVRIYTFW